MSENQEVKDQHKEDTTTQEQPAKDSAEETGKAEVSEDTKEPKEDDPMAKLEQELKDAKDQQLRLFAEFENFRKRTAKERIELFGTANQELMAAMLPVLDDFQRAMKAEEDSKANEGMKLIYQKLESTLKNKGLKPMEDTTGKEFNADTMEAVTQIPAPDKKMKGKVVDEIERGYMLGNKILRYAKVVVGQ